MQFTDLSVMLLFCFHFLRDAVMQPASFFNINPNEGKCTQLPKAHGVYISVIHSVESGSLYDTTIEPRLTYIIYMLYVHSYTYCMFID